MNLQWTLLTDDQGVYYRTFDHEGSPFCVIKGLTGWYTVYKHSPEVGHYKNALEAMQIAHKAIVDRLHLAMTLGLA